MVSFLPVSPPKPHVHLSSPHTYYMIRPYHSSRFDRPNNIYWGVQNIKVLTIFSLFPFYLVPLRPRYPPQHPILKHPQPTSSLNVSDQVSHSQKATGKIIVLSILTLILRRSRTGTVWFYTSTSNKRAARPKLYTKSLTRDLKRMYSRFTPVRISINL